MANKNPKPLKPVSSSVIVHRPSVISHRLSSVRLFFWLLGLILAACVIGAVVPQGEAPAKYEGLFGPAAARLITALGLDRLFSSAWFMVLLAGLGINLAACSIRRIQTIRVRPGVFVTHIAVLVILTGALVRSLFGQHGVLPMRVGETAGEFFIGDRTRRFPFEIRLDNFEIDRRSNGKHRLQFMDHTSMKQETLMFDRPGTYRLNPLEADVRVTGVYPDFRMGEHGPESVSDRPDNPAVQIEIVKNGHVSSRWLFAKFPEFEAHGGQEAGPEMNCCSAIRAIYEYVPGDIGQFRSRLTVLENSRPAAQKTIWVNEPFRHKGYTFYQSGYDPADPTFSSLQVAKDPSVPIVYAGFVLLPLGLVWSVVEKKMNDGQ